MTSDPRHPVRAGQTYLIPASLEDGFLHLLTIEELPLSCDWLCLVLETGQVIHAHDFFFEPSRLVLDAPEVEPG